MKSKNNDWIWIIIIAILLFIIAINFNRFFGTDSQFETDEKKKKAKRISNLKNEKSILLSHLDKLKELQDKIKKQSEKIWRKSIRFLVIIFAFCNLSIIGTIYLITGKIVFSDVLTLYSILYSAFLLVFFFLTYKFFNRKEFVFEWLKEYSYKKVAGSRDAEYFETKSETIQHRIAQIDLEISQLQG